MDDERSVWQLGLALGLAVDAGLLLAGALNGYALTADNLPRLTQVAVAIVALSWTGLPVAVAGTQALLRALLWIVERRAAPQIAPTIEKSAPTIAVEQKSEQDTAAAWRTALERFFRSGDNAGGFSIRKLENVVGGPTWARLTDFYASEAGCNVLRVAPGDEGTVWGHGWGLDKALQALAAGKIPLPPLPEVPNVAEYGTVNTTHDAARQRTTRRRTVDSTAKAID